MKRRKLLLLLGLLAAVPLLKGSEIEDLAITLSKDPDVQTLTVCCVSYMVETPLKIKPHAVSKDYPYQYISKDNRAKVAEFLKNVHGQDFKSSDGSNVDCRWVFIVSDTSGHERMIIYADAFLNEAFANNSSFKLDPSFRDWVDKMFRKAFDLDDILEWDKKKP